MTTTNKPLQKIELRPLIATIWAKHAVTREGEPFTAYSIDIQRRFRGVNKDTGIEEYRFTSSLRARDLKLAALIAGMAETFLVSIGAGPQPAEPVEVLAEDDIPFHDGGIQ